MGPLSRKTYFNGFTTTGGSDIRQDSRFESWNRLAEKYYGISQPVNWTDRSGGNLGDIIADDACGFHMDGFYGAGHRSRFHEYDNFDNVEARGRLLNRPAYQVHPNILNFMQDAGGFRCKEGEGRAGRSSEFSVPGIEAFKSCNPLNNETCPYDETEDRRAACVVTPGVENYFPLSDDIVGDDADYKHEHPRFEDNGICFTRDCYERETNDDVNEICAPVPCFLDPYHRYKGGSEKYLTYAHLEVEDLDPVQDFVCPADFEILGIETKEECYNIANAFHDLGLWHVNNYKYTCSNDDSNPCSTDADCTESGSCQEDGRWNRNNFWRETNTGDSTIAPFSSVKGGYFGFYEGGAVDDPNICYVYGKDDTKRNCSEPAAGVDNAKTYEAVLPEFEARSADFHSERRFFKSKKIPMLKSTLQKAGKERSAGGSVQFISLQERPS